jgi:hypothetical protein
MIQREIQLIQELIYECMAHANAIDLQDRENHADEIVAIKNKLAKLEE